MTKDQTLNVIDWFKKIALLFEDLFHQIQYWFDNDSWMQRLVAGLASDETTTA